MKYYLIPESVLNEFVSKVVRNGDRVTATIKTDKSSKRNRK